MAATFHLAEEALALHLLLQHLESLVDIVVANENLHAAFPLRSNARWLRWPSAWAPGARICTHSGAEGTRGAT